MNKIGLEAFTRDAAKSIKTPDDFNRMLKKIPAEAALNTELDEHLSYDMHQKTDTPNSRNGLTHKTLRAEDGSEG